MCQCYTCSEITQPIQKQLPNDDKNSTQPNKYFADKAVEWFKDNNTKLYHNPKMPNHVKVYLSIAFFALISPMIFYCT